MLERRCSHNFTSFPPKQNYINEIFHNGNTVYIFNKCRKKNKKKPAQNIESVRATVIAYLIVDSMPLNRA